MGRKAFSTLPLWALLPRVHRPRSSQIPDQHPSPLWTSGSLGTGVTGSRSPYPLPAWSENANADALSRSPQESEFGIIAAIQEDSATAKGGEEASLGQKQRADPELVEIMQYLETGVLPADEKKARELALTKSQYLLQDGVLYRVEKDQTL